MISAHVPQLESSIDFKRNYFYNLVLAIERGYKKGSRKKIHINILYRRKVAKCLKTNISTETFKLKQLTLLIAISNTFRGVSAFL